MPTRKTDRKTGINYLIFSIVTKDKYFLGHRVSRSANLEDYGKYRNKTSLNLNSKKISIAIKIA
jgi:hypothetical protein